MFPYRDMMPLGSLKGFAILASDGRLGTVNDFLFDDATWHVRWLVVRTGMWLAGRIALVHPLDLAQPDDGSRTLAVRLTQAQVAASPDILLDEPVSRQTEYGMQGYAWHDPAWGNPRYLAGPLSGLGLHVSKSRLVEEKAMHKVLRGGGLTDGGDPHLRSVVAVMGTAARATDGPAGTIEDILADRSDWSVRGVVIRTRHWWPDPTAVVVAPSQVREVSWSRQEVTLAITCDEIKTSQPYDPAGA